MFLNRRQLLGGAFACGTLAALPRTGHAGEPPTFGYQMTRRRIEFGWTYDGNDFPMGQYVFQDDRILRPYFANLAWPVAKGTMTRHHPPRRGDAEDHADMHPGLWIAFGDINGHDFWRNKARVVHEKFTSNPSNDSNEATLEFDFACLNRYETEAVKPLARETFACRMATIKREGNWRLDWDSTIAALDEPLIFGDQEEMGLGLRLATELTVNNGGTIENSHGDKNEKGCWGKTAEWCRYYARRNDRDFGWLVIPHPENFKPCSFHVRDYGLLVANPFAEKAFGRSEKPAQTVVKPGEKLRLRFGIVAFRADRFDKFDPTAEAKRYVEATKG